MGMVRRRGADHPSLVSPGRSRRDRRRHRRSLCRGRPGRDDTCECPPPALATGDPLERTRLHHARGHGRPHRRHRRPRCARRTYVIHRDARFARGRRRAYHRISRGRRPRLRRGRTPRVSIRWRIVPLRHALARCGDARGRRCGFARRRALRGSLSVRALGVPQRRGRRAREPARAAHDACRLRRDARALSDPRCDSHRSRDPRAPRDHLARAHRCRRRCPRASVHPAAEQTGFATTYRDLSAGTRGRPGVPVPSLEPPHPRRDVAHHRVRRGGLARAAGAVGHLALRRRARRAVDRAGHRIADRACRRAGRPRGGRTRRGCGRVLDAATSLVHHRDGELDGDRRRGAHGARVPPRADHPQHAARRGGQGRGPGPDRGSVLPRSRRIRDHGVRRLRTVRRTSRGLARAHAHRDAAGLVGALMLLLAIVAITTLAANSARQLRYTAVAFFAVALAAHLIDDGTLAAAQVLVSAAAALVASAILFVAARDRRFGEDPGWRLWIATIVAAATTAAAFAFLRPQTGDEINTNLLGPDPSGVTTDVAAFWLLSSGIAILLTARGAVRGSLGALLMLTGTQLLVQQVPGPHLALTLLLSWLQVVVALAGAFRIVNQRAAREA